MLLTVVAFLILEIGQYYLCEHQPVDSLALHLLLYYRIFAIVFFVYNLDNKKLEQIDWMKRLSINSA